MMKCSVRRATTKDQLLEGNWRGFLWHLGGGQRRFPPFLHNLWKFNIFICLGSKQQNQWGPRTDNGLASHHEPSIVCRSSSKRQSCWRGPWHECRIVFARRGLFAQPDFKCTFTFGVLHATCFQTWIKWSFSRTEARDRSLTLDCPPSWRIRTAAKYWWGVVF